MRELVIQNYKGGKIVRTFKRMYRFVDDDYRSEEYNTISELVERAEDGRTTLAKEVDSGEESKFVEPGAEQESGSEATASGNGNTAISAGSETQQTVVEETATQTKKRAGRKKQA